MSNTNARETKAGAKAEKAGDAFPRTRTGGLTFRRVLTDGAS